MLAWPVKGQYGKTLKQLGRIALLRVPLIYGYHSRQVIANLESPKKPFKKHLTC